MAQSILTQFKAFYPRMLRKNYSLKKTVLSGIGILLLGGCQSDDILKATKEYATLSNKAQDVFPIIQQDLVATCIRSVNLAMPEIGANPAAMGAARESSILKCRKGEGATAQAMSDIHDLIILYLNSLAGLGTDKSFGKGITALGESVKSLPQFETGNAEAQAKEIKELIDAGTTISVVVSDYLTKAYRANKVRNAVLQSDQALSTLVYALSNATYFGYIGDRLRPDESPGLARENYNLNYYYGAPLRQSMRSLPRQHYQDYIEVSLNNQWVAEQAKIDERRAFASKYLRLLKDIACDHTQLRLLIEKRTDLKPSDVNPNCKDSAQGGLKVNARTSSADIALQARMKFRIALYRERIQNLAVQYDQIFKNTR
jgi:hypothetical protein